MNETDLFGNAIESSGEQLSREVYAVKSEDVERLQLMKNELITESSCAKFFFEGSDDFGGFAIYPLSTALDFYADDLSKIVIGIKIHNTFTHFITERQLVESILTENGAMVFIQAFPYNDRVFNSLESAIEAVEDNTEESNEVSLKFKPLYTKPTQQLSHMFQTYIDWRN